MRFEIVHRRRLKAKFYTFGIKEARMTIRTYEAVFQNGAFRPVEPVSSAISEGQQVRLVVEVEETKSVLDLAGEVYADLSDEEVKEVEKIALERRDFFAAPTP